MVRAVYQISDLLKACRTPISRPQLVIVTGIERGVVRKWVDALVENGLLVEVEREPRDLTKRGPIKSGVPARQFQLARAWGGKA